MPTRRILIGSLLALLAADLVGGLLAVAADVSSWSQAWGAEARLAAPLPMIAGQVLLTALALCVRNRWAAVPAVLLALACLVSVVSGFFDGGLGDERLSLALSAYQVLLLAVTAVVGGAATSRFFSALRPAP